MPKKQLRGESMQNSGGAQESGAGRPGPDVAIVLSDADRERLRYKAGRGLLRALAAQAVMGLAAGAVSWLVAGVDAGASALIGAAAYFIPNALFAMRLPMGLLSARPASPFTFFMGEIAKPGAAVFALGLAPRLG